MNKYKVAIIDDERLAREEIKRYLARHSEFQVIGEASNVDEGVRLIDSNQPNLILLDIEMPEKNGFDLLEELTTAPEVVFTTAYSEFATKAFDVNALDYLVKPIREERFDKSIEKVKKELRKIEKSPSSFAMHQKIFIKDGDQCYFVPLTDIRYIESLENYARFHFSSDKAMLKKSLNSIEEKLDSRAFFRINRSQIVNINYIKEIFAGLNNKLKLVLDTGEEFEVSSRQSIRFKNWNSL